MSNNLAEVAAKLVAMIQNEKDFNEVIRYQTTQRDVSEIRVIIPENVSNSLDFSRVLLDLGQNPSRIFRVEKVKMRNRKNLSAYILYIDNNLVSYNKEKLRDLLNSIDVNSSKVEDVSPFIYNIFLEWNSFTGVRSHRQLTTDIVGGYLKQRKIYSHYEILTMVRDYGKWAKAYHLAIENGENSDIFWFHQTTLQGLLRSNKMFANHLIDGWKKIKILKKIPDEYCDVSEEKTQEQEESTDRLLTKIATMIFNGESISAWEHIYVNTDQYKYKDIIDSKVKEMQDAS